MNAYATLGYGLALAGLVTISASAAASTASSGGAQGAPPPPDSRHDAPFACVPSALSPAERKQHFGEYGPRLRALVSGVHELPNGYEFTFPSDPATYRVLAAWMYQERLCCSFLDFTLALDRGEGPLRLRLTGREGVKEFIVAEFGPWLSRERTE